MVKDSTSLDSLPRFDLNLLVAVFSVRAFDPAADARTLRIGLSDQAEAAIMKEVLETVRRNAPGVRARVGVAAEDRTTPRNRRLTKSCAFQDCSPKGELRQESVFGRICSLMNEATHAKWCQQTQVPHQMLAEF